MPTEKRLKILTEAEIADLFGPPVLNLNDQRFFFALNEIELAQCQKIRRRDQRCMFVVLLGYFKVKPITLIPGYHQIKHDIKYVCSEVIPGSGLSPFNLAQKTRVRIYHRIYELAGHERWENERHSAALIKDLSEHARAWAQPRSLFDRAIEYLSVQKIGIPGYTVLQDIISGVVGTTNRRLIRRLDDLISVDLADELSDLVEGKDSVTLRRLRLSARNFTGSELQKELVVHKHVQSWMPEVNRILSELSISLKNQQYFAERVTYYGAKLKRQPIGHQRLYLLCYLQSRWQLALERIADGFVHHVNQRKQKAKIYAREAVYLDWQRAANNVGKAAQVLRLFIDDSVDQQQPFGTLKQRALKLLAAKDLESVCLFLNDQKRSVEEATWQYFDHRVSLREGLLRELFLCLHFEGSEKTRRLAAALHRAQRDLIVRGELSKAAMGSRLPTKKQLSFLQDTHGVMNTGRYEWFLYLQIPNRLNGQITLPNVVKYRALEADLVNRERWVEEKESLLKRTQLPKLTVDPNKLINQMARDLNIRLREVSNYLEQDDNRNIILRNRKGKRHWRLPTANKKYLVNNPFFEQIPTTGVADVLRMVDRDTGFLDDFKHVLGAQSKSRAHEFDLLAILVGNATNQGIYGIAQISDRTYDQLSIIQANYLRLETLNAANDRINNSTAKLPVFKHYNIQEDIVHASADGQKFEARRETFKTRYSSKYFGTQKGVSAMSLIANHAAINARVIGANEHESHHIFDLLMNNSSEIVPDVLSTDTHGVNHINFALLDLFGYSFAPRYARVGRVINEMFDIKEDKHKRIQLRLKKSINTKRIMPYWDTAQRIMISLYERKTTQATLVRKLSGYKSSHPLLGALTEYNRMVKANYLLNYIDDVSLRDYVQRALNRGEAYHQLRRAISSVNGDQFRGSSDEEIQLWNECARLMTNAIIYFNSAILSQLLTSFEYQEDEEKIQIVKQASPVAWYNINLKGTYNFEFGEKLPDLDDLMSSIEGYKPVQKKYPPPET